MADCDASLLVLVHDEGMWLLSSDHRHVLYRCLGLKPNLEVDIYPAVALHPGDLLLLCSDGLWDMVYPSERLVAMLSRGGDLLPMCRRLVDAANKAGGEDNVTVLLVRMEGRDE